MMSTTHGHHTPTPHLLWRFAPAWIALATAVFLPLQVRSDAFTVTAHDQGFTFQGPRLELVIRNGSIVGITNRLTGERHADPTLGETRIPRGMGHLAGHSREARQLHIPWGSKELNQDVDTAAFPSQHYPADLSAFRLAESESGAVGTWTGLTNGSESFPDETLSVEVALDSDTGQTRCRAWGQSPRAGVYGVMVPVVNLHADHRIVSTSFGGMVYEKTMPPALRPLGKAPFIEAPVLAMEGTHGTVGLWKEDPAFNPYFCFINWTGRTWGVALEHLNLMPFEPHHEVRSVSWHLDAGDGGWVEAMTPYRTWYRDLFAAEIAQRDSISWAGRIRIIIDAVSETKEVYDVLAATFDPETILLHEWNARKPSFTGQLPAMEPKDRYPAQVTLAHAYGFRTMAYVNSYCAEVGAPAFVEDRIAEIALTRRYPGLWRYDRGPTDWKDCAPGSLVYTDPLAPGWRADHVKRMVTWRERTGTDANYEDTAGACGDFGNGIVRGKRAAEGTVALFRELMKAQPDVPMAAEYGPAPIAFAVHWPLHYQQVWGNDASRVFWLSHMRPVCAFLFGHRSWTPNIRAESNLLQHVVMGCSDALGGIAQFPGTLDALNADRGAMVQMKRRAQLFASRQLVPHFPAGRWPDHLACVYRDEAGRIYRYHANERLQRMSGPDSRPLYERVTGVNRVATDLTLPGWPAVGHGEILALDPNVRYALIRGPHDRTAVQWTAVSEHVKIQRFYGDDRFTVTVLAATGEEPLKRLRADAVANRQTQAVVLDQELLPPPLWDKDAERTMPVALEANLPAHVLFCHAAPRKPPLNQFFETDMGHVRYVDIQTGLDSGDRPTRKLVRHWDLPITGQVAFYALNWGGEAEVVLDYLVQPPGPNAVLEVFTRNMQTKHGNGVIARLYINGKEVHQHDFGPQKVEGKTVWDTHVHRWRVPLDSAPDVPVLVSIASDGKASDNADSQWWSAPRFITAPEHPAFVKLVDGDVVPEL